MNHIYESYPPNYQCLLGKGIRIVTAASPAAQKKTQLNFSVASTENLQKINQANKITLN